MATTALGSPTLAWSHFLLLTIGMFLVETVLVVVLHYLKGGDQASKEETELIQEAARKRREAEHFLAPDTFVLHTKLTREATQLEVKAGALEKQRLDANNSPTYKMASQAAQLHVPLIAFLVYMLVQDNRTVVVYLPSDRWASPFGYFLAMGGGSEFPAYVSSVGWVLACSRVFSKLAKLVVSGGK